MKKVSRIVAYIPFLFLFLLFQFCSNKKNPFEGKWVGSIHSSPGTYVGIYTFKDDQLTIHYPEDTLHAQWFSKNNCLYILKEGENDTLTYNYKFEKDTYLFEEQDKKEKITIGVLAPYQKLKNKTVQNISTEQIKTLLNNKVWDMQIKNPLPDEEGISFRYDFEEHGYIFSQVFMKNDTFSVNPSQRWDIIQLEGLYILHTFNPLNQYYLLREVSDQKIIASVIYPQNHFAREFIFTKFPHDSQSLEQVKNSIAGKWYMVYKHEYDAKVKNNSPEIIAFNLDDSASYLDVYFLNYENDYMKLPSRPFTFSYDGKAILLKSKNGEYFSVKYFLKLTNDTLIIDPYINRRDGINQTVTYIRQN